MRPFLVMTLVALASCGPGAVAATPAPRATVAVATAAPTPAASPDPAPTPSPPPRASPSPAASASPTPLPTGTPPVAASAAIHYVAIGASDTVGVGSLDPVSGSWPSRLAALLPAGSTYRNLGVSGSLAVQAEREQLPAALLERPTVVTMWLAVNDLNALVPATELAAALDRMAGALAKGSAARIFMGNVPDLRGVPVYASADPAALLARIQAYNAAIAALAVRYSGRVVVVDLFTGSAELMTKVVVATDGFHPSDAGYILIAERFADAMRKAGIALRPGP